MKKVNYNKPQGYTHSIINVLLHCKLFITMNKKITVISKHRRGAEGGSVIPNS